MKTLGGRLKPAHQGYFYQDLATAYLLIASLVYRYDSLLAEQKAVEDDRIDDLEIAYAGRRTRRQLKFSTDPTQKLTEEHFTSKTSTLRIDHLVLSYTRAGEAAADEYRLCATWQPPDDPSLLGLLRPSDAPSTVADHSAHCFRFRGEGLWPAGEQPIWSWLNQATDITRDQVLAFCDRFIIELGLPPASFSVITPGPLERALLDLLTTGIGIGRYPNNRDPVDVAALTLALAHRARTHQMSLTPGQIETLLGLRTDYGMVAQAFPVDPSVVQDRPTLTSVLRTTALRGEHQILTGPPGSGKSWELTRLTDHLRADGALVARHYCYLEPGDDLVERRITRDVLFGNLMFELAEAEPSLRETTTLRYSAGLRELEAMLSRAGKLGRPIVIIVDGLDHIARVKAEASGVRDVDTDIVEQVATLRLPPGVALIIGSQPGSHLDPLHHALVAISVQTVPPWSPDEVAALAGRLGLVRALERAGIADPKPTVALLAERSEGNPLYATYLSRELSGLLSSGIVLNPQDWLREAPIIHGNIAHYYAHLYGHASETAQAIADILGVVDFGLSEPELRGMLPPPLRDWLPQALRHMRPILVEASGQGGVRIFHESFRRFMADELRRRGRSLANALEPVIEWLRERGFFPEAKAYRFLLPALTRAGRLDEALALVGVSFVSESVRHGHPLDAVQRNLAIALDIAACTLRWPDLVRCVELHRAAHTCFEEKLAEPLRYWETYLDLFGPHALVERLLFDGRPTQPKELGLVLCLLADDAGATPPWPEYLEHSDPPTDERRLSSAREEAWKQRVSLSRLHGLIRLKGMDAVAERILTFLIDNGDALDPDYICTLSFRIAQVAGADALEDLLIRGSDPTRLPRVLSGHVIALLRLGLARALFTGDGQRAAAVAAQAALAGLGSPVLMVECRDLGAPLTNPAAFADQPSSLSLGLGDYPGPDPGTLRRWIASIRLLAGVDEAGLDAEWARLEGEGWYRCWLRFLILLARAEAANRSGMSEPSARAAFVELARDVRPFAGKPRPCDLYSIRTVIAESLAWAFSLLHTEDDWLEALRHLRVAMEGTASSLHREVGGPIPPEVPLEILLPHAHDPRFGAVIRRFAETLIAETDLRGTYYETHAEHAMLFAQILNRMDDSQVAHMQWDKIATYLSGYGFRKDITIYEILDSIPALLTVDRHEAFNALVAAQPLVEAVLRHTDGKETNRAPNRWFRALLACDMTAALSLLAQSMSVRDAALGWPIEQALRDALSAAITAADPIILDALDSTLPIHAEYEDQGESLADERLTIVSRLLEGDQELGVAMLRRLIAQAEGDGRHYNRPALERLQAYAVERGISVPKVYPVGSETRGEVLRGRRPTYRPADAALPGINGSYFPAHANLLDIMAGIRRAGHDRRWDDTNWDGFVNALGYRLIGLISEGKEEEVIRLLHVFAREVFIVTSSQPHPLVEVAEGLEHHGCHRSAAIAYALAYRETRGGLGWLSMGDAEHEWMLLRGVTLNRAETLQTLATELAYALRQISYNAGITRHLIERAAGWGEPPMARECWWSAYTVIKHRLPTSTDRIGWFERFVPDNVPDWSVGQALTAVLLARVDHPALSRKVEALVGIVRVLAHRPDLMAAPLSWRLARDAPVTSVLLALDALLKAEPEDHSVTRAQTDMLGLYAHGELWGLRVLARALLERLGLTTSTVVTISMQRPEEMPSPDRIRRILSAESGDRLDRLTKFWPDIQPLVAVRLQALFERAEIHRERCRDRYELMFGRTRDERPATPVLLWETELLEVVLQEVINELPRYLLGTGRWHPSIDTQLLALVLPRTAVHLALAASRVPRPPYPPPVLSTAGSGDVIALDDHDPRFPGWRRLAYVESQYTRDADRRYGPPTGLVRVFAGTVVTPLGYAPPEDFPFCKGDSSTWWTEEEPPIQLPLDVPPGPIVGLARVTDWLGDALLLIPPLWVRKLIQLVPAHCGDPLAWHDSRGVPSVALRSWRIRDPEALWGEPVEYHGSDLVIRPDLFERIGFLTGSLLREVRLVRRTHLT